MALDAKIWKVLKQQKEKARWGHKKKSLNYLCLLYTSDAADE